MTAQDHLEPQDSSAGQDGSAVGHGHLLGEGAERVCDSNHDAIAEFIASLALGQGAA